MKRFLSLILSFVLIALFAGCDGVYTPPISGTSDQSQSGGGGDGETQTEFTVTLTLDREQFIPYYMSENVPDSERLTCHWTGTGGTYSAAFDDEGVATVYGLDGEYQVTLSNFPSTMSNITYDSNSYFADNDHTHVEIEMLHIIPLTGAGTMYNAIPIRYEGVYRTVIKSADSPVFYEYFPQNAGSFSIESIVDITANDVNPSVDIYYGTTAFKNFYRTLEDGGTSSTYTRNFKMYVDADRSEIGGCWNFEVHADCRSGKYPVTVDFVIRFESDYEIVYPEYERMVPKGPFLKAQGRGNVRYVYYDTNYVLRDGDKRFKLYRQEDGGDGFYHLYDEEKYLATDGYGPLIYAKITQDCEVLVTEDGLGFTASKIYTEYDQLSVVAADGRYKAYKYFIKNALTSEADSYAEYCNADGAHPVNEELRQFLQDYATSQRYFMDGYGWAESMLQSDEYNQWQFACFYYDGD